MSTSQITQKHRKCPHCKKVATVEARGTKGIFFVDVCNDCKKDPLFHGFEVQEI